MYDQAWISQLMVTAPSPEKPVRAEVRLVASDGTDLGPKQAVKRIPDLLGLAAERAEAGKPALAHWLALSYEVVSEFNAEEGLL